MFVEKGIDELLEMLDEPELVYYYYRPSLPVGEALKHSPNDYKFWVNHCFWDMKHLNWFMYDNGLGFLLIPVSELLGNALIHGNSGAMHNAPNGDPLKSLSVKVFLAKNGLLVRVRNEGEGFDYKDVIDRFRNGREYASHVLGGNGMINFDHPDLLVSYEDNGRTSNILYVF